MGNRALTPIFLSHADPRGRPMADGARDLVGGFLDQRAPLQLHAVGGRGERERCHQRAAVIAHAGGDAAHADLRFLGIDRPALALDALEVALEQREVGHRVPGVRREAGAPGVIAQPREAFLEQEKLPRRGHVQRRARADHVHDPHRRAPRGAALDVHDLVAVAHGKVDRLAGLRMQLAHHRQGELAHADARLDEIAELEQPHAEPVASRLDVGRRSLHAALVGQDATMPVAIALTGVTGLNWADGEMLAARAAERFGVPFTLSTMSICSIEDVASAVAKPFWFQLYVMRDRGFAASLIERARAAKCSALVLTLDLQVQGQRHQDLKNGLAVPPRLTLGTFLDVLGKPSWALNVLRGKRKSFGNLEGRIPNAGSLSTLSQWIAGQFDPTLSLKDVEWVKNLWGGKDRKST